jgi:hypothetical protein
LQGLGDERCVDEGHAARRLAALARQDVPADAPLAVGPARMVGADRLVQRQCLADVAGAQSRLGQVDQVFALRPARTDADTR